jgi:hypothetical protein
MRASPLRLGALLVLLQCAAPEPGAASPPFQARLGLERTDGRAADVFEAGASVVLVLTLRNPTDAPQTLALATAQTHDFAISTRTGPEVWRWSAGRRFAQMLTELRLAPGEEKSFRATWSPGPALAPGRYRAEGWVGPRGKETRAEAVDFSVD